MRLPRRRALLLAMVAILASASAIAGVQSTPPRLPQRLESYLSNVVRLSTGERKLLINGSPVSKLLDADASKEVAVFGAVWIDGPVRRYVNLVKDIERFERGGGFRVTRRISSPPKLEDFSDLRLSSDEVNDLRSCRVGDCEIKLGQRALDAMRREVDWNSAGAHAAAETVMRRLAHEYVIGYLEGGNDRLAIYRDSSRPTFVAEEFRSMVDEMPELTTYMLDVRRYLLQYPKVQLPNATSFLYWQETEFGLKPTIRISHLTIRESADDAVVASKMLYASHYFWTGLELRALVADPARGPGFWFATVNRSRSDGLSGFVGSLIRGRVRSEAESGMLAALKVTKAKLEKP